MPTPPRGTPSPEMRHSTKPKVNPTREEIIALTNSKVNDIGTSHRVLEKLRYVIIGEPYTVRSLSTALLQTAQSKAVKKGPLLDSLRAIAILLTEISEDQEADTIARKVTEWNSQPTTSAVR